MTLEEKQKAMRDRQERQRESKREPLIINTSEGQKGVDFYELIARTDIICTYCRKETTYANKRTGQIMPCNKCKAKALTLSKYNLTLFQYYQMLREQQYRCALCTERFTDNNKPVIDYCHESNLVRGLLCRPCNIGLKMFLEDYNIFEAAIKYIKNNKLKRLWWNKDNYENNS